MIAINTAVQKGELTAWESHKYATILKPGWAQTPPLQELAGDAPESHGLP